MAVDPFASPLSSGSLTPTAPRGGGDFISTLFGGGPDPLPGQFTDVNREVPDLTQSADFLKNYGTTLLGQGGSVLNMASQGQLTGPQQAQLDQYRTGLTNTARQQFYNMGRTPDKDTAFIGQTADIDAKVNAMAQQQIQSSIALGLGELSSGSSLFGQSLGFDQTAINALISVGNAQLQQDKDYRQQLTDTFKAIGTIFGATVGAASGNPFGAISSLLGGAGTSAAKVGANA